MAHSQPSGRHGTLQSMERDLPEYEANEHAERLAAYVRPYVLALLRIIIACYERDMRDERIAAAMSWTHAPRR